MGWTCTFKEPGVPLTQWFIDRGVLRWSGDSPYNYRVLDSALVKFVHYAAIERIDKASGEREVFATVILTKMFRRSRSDGMNFCWKDMSESMGPWEDECPERILNLLTDTDDENALDWRNRCRDNIARKKSLPKLSKGVRLIFTEPVQFNTGPVSELVVLLTKGQKIICTHPNTGDRYRVTRPWLVGRVSDQTVRFA